MTVGALAAVALAADPPTCPPEAEVSLADARWLRSVSLDLRGVVATPEEASLLDAGDLPEAVLDDWLTSPAFADRAVRWHRSLLWNNVTDQELLNLSAYLVAVDGIWYRSDSALTYRGVADRHCGDFAATFGPDGRPIGIVQADGAVQEGWIYVAPYWDPENPVPVCAFDAQEGEVAADGTLCRTRAGVRDAQCGCGPALDWCGTFDTHVAVAAAFGEDVDLRVRALVEDDAPYTDLLTGETGWINGPIAHFLSEQTQMYGGIHFFEAPFDPADIPDSPWSDETFVPVDLGPQASGVLTSPAWLLRFQSNRARASHFYDAFLCQPFQAPVDGLTGLSDPDPPLDLTVRAGCQYCHAILEPAAAWWGRWQPHGGGYLRIEEYPAFDPECEAQALAGDPVTTHCSAYLTTALDDEEIPWLGWLRSYEFLEERHQTHPDDGPAGLVAETVADGRLARCVAENTTRWLLGRSPLPEDDGWLDGLAATLVDSGWSWREMIKAIVRDERYRRVR